MRHHLLGCALLLALAGCAAQPPRCAGRLTPINRQALLPGPHSGGGRPAARSARAARP